MEITITTQNELFRTVLAEKIIESLKIYLVIKPLQLIYGKRYLKNKFELLMACAENTVGKDYAMLLQKERVDFIPVFQNHDLKHLVLGYGMSSVDELRMQAYLLGNGNRSVFCLLFLASAVILPSSWSILKEDYRLGKISPRILDLNLNNCIHLPTKELRQNYSLSR